MGAKGTLVKDLHPFLLSKSPLASNRFSAQSGPWPRSARPGCHKGPGLELESSADHEESICGRVSPRMESSRFGRTALRGRNARKKGPPLSLQFTELLAVIWIPFESHPDSSSSYNFSLFQSSFENKWKLRVRHSWAAHHELIAWCSLLSQQQTSCLGRSLSAYHWLDFLVEFGI